MKWPFVSRRVVDAYEAILQRSQDDRRADAIAADRRYETLMEQHRLLLDRALPVPSSPVMATAAREPRVPDPISKAIREEAGTDTRLAAFLRKRAKELKTEHTDWTPQQIADELSQWQSTETDGTT